MKQLWKSQGLGLLWFVITYALIRVILRHPNAAIQEVEMMVITAAALAFSWLVLAFISDSLSGLSASLNLGVTTSFFFVYWGDFGLIKVQIALAVLIIMSVFIFGHEFIKMVKKEKGLWLPVLVNIVVLLGFIFSLEAIIPLFF